MAGRPKKEYTPVESISGLKDIIASDSSLTESQKILLTEMALDFDTDFEENLFASSIELNKKYPFGLDAWATFLTMPKVSRYLGGFAQETLMKRADSDIASGKNVRDAANLKKQLTGDKGGKDNFGFVLMYIPEERERTYEPTSIFEQD